MGTLPGPPLVISTSQSPSSPMNTNLRPSPAFALGFEERVSLSGLGEDFRSGRVGGEQACAFSYLHGDFE